MGYHISISMNYQPLTNRKHTHHSKNLSCMYAHRIAIKYVFVYA